MKRPAIKLIEAILVIGCFATSTVALAVFEGVTPDGRRIVLYENGTWRYADPAASGPDDKSKEQGEAVLSLEHKIEAGNNCRFEVRLANNFPYEIRSFVPFYSAYRANGVRYDTVTSDGSFTSLKPGDQQTRSFLFRGIACSDISRIQVSGGDKCDMGDLDKYNSVQGQCLARVKVAESDLVRFDK